LDEINSLEATMKPLSTSSRAAGRRIFILLSLSISVFGSAVAKDKPLKTYPERGKIVAIHVGNNSRTLPVYTDSYGKTHGGNSIKRKPRTYRIETNDRIYELTEPGRGVANTLGDDIDFRVEKDKAFIRDGQKERKCDVTGVEQKPPTQKP
jgi:hypothetical protein